MSQRKFFVQFKPREGAVWTETEELEPEVADDLVEAFHATGWKARRVMETILRDFS